MVYNLQVEADQSYIANGIVVHNCAAIPQGPTYADLGFVGIEEPPPVRRGEDVFADLDEATQRKILGPKYEPWKEGKFEFGALSREVNDATWGPMRVEATLKSLLGEGGE